MADYATLKAAIQAVIYENGNQEITGSVMQATLLAMVNSLGANYQYAGIATPSTNPGTPDQNVFYLASTAGTYVNFGNIVLAENEVAILKYNGSWTKETSGFASAEKVSQLDQIINGHTSDVADYTKTVETGGASTGYPDIRDLSAFEVGKTYKITVKANETSASGIRIITRNSSNADVQTICSNFAITSGQTYTFYWTRQASETRLFSTRSDGRTYACVFTISHAVEVGGLTNTVETHTAQIASLQSDVGNLKLTVDGGLEPVTSNDFFTRQSYIKTDGSRVLSGAWRSTDFIPIDEFIGCKVWLHPSVASMAFYSSKDDDDFLGYAGTGTYGTEGTFLKSGVTVPAGTNYVIVSTEHNPGSSRPYTASSVTALETNPGLDKRIVTLERTAPKKGWAHISFDDVVYCLHDITVNAGIYTSIFDNEFFAVLKNLHDTYGTVFSLFVFLEDATTGGHATGWTLANTTTAFAEEFAANSSWLKFGLHSLDKNTNYATRSAENAAADYASFVTSIMAITGTVDSIDRLPRLANFAGTQDAMLALQGCDAGIIGALAAYDSRQSYHLSAAESAFVYKNGVLHDTANHFMFYTSLSALETTAPTTIWGAYNVPATMGRFHNLEWMMHEYAIGGQDYGYSQYNFEAMVFALTQACILSNDNGYRWGYPQNAALDAGL